MRIVLLFLTLLLIPAAPAEAMPALESGPRQAERRALSTIAVGDSITQGGGTSNPYYNSYPAQAGVGSLGVGGTCVLKSSCERSGNPWVMDWLPNELASYSPRPGRIVVLLGINDVFQSTPSELVTGLKSLRRYLKSQGYTVVFGTITPPPAQYAGMNNTRLPVNAWIRRQRNYVDYAKPLENSNHLLKAKFQSPAGDQHPGDRGARRMGRTLKKWLAAG